MFPSVIRTIGWDLALAATWDSGLVIPVQARSTSGALEAQGSPLPDAV